MNNISSYTLFEKMSFDHRDIVMIETYLEELLNVSIRISPYNLISIETKNDKNIQEKIKSLNKLNNFFYDEYKLLLNVTYNTYNIYNVHVTDEFLYEIYKLIKINDFNI